MLIVQVWICSPQGTHALVAHAFQRAHSVCNVMMCFSSLSLALCWFFSSGCWRKGARVLCLYMPPSFPLRSIACVFFSSVLSGQSSV